MSGEHEYLKDGIWHGKRPPAGFVGTVRHAGKEWKKTEPSPKGRDHKGRPVGHECCPCPACAAWEATLGHARPEIGNGVADLGPAAPDEEQLPLFDTPGYAGRR